MEKTFKPMEIKTLEDGDLEKVSGGQGNAKQCPACGCFQIAQTRDENGNLVFKCYGCGKAGLPKPEYGRLTRRGDTLYVHILDTPVGYAAVPGAQKGQVRARWLYSGAEAQIADDWISRNYPDHTFLRLGPDPVLPDPADTVIAVFPENQP